MRNPNQQEYDRHLLNVLAKDHCTHRFCQWPVAGRKGFFSYKSFGLAPQPGELLFTLPVGCDLGDSTGASRHFQRTVDSNSQDFAYFPATTTCPSVSYVTRPSRRRL